MWQVIKSVLAAFLGVQSDSQRRHDFEHGKPMSFIVIGIVMAMILVGLIVLVAVTAAN